MTERENRDLLYEILWNAFFFAFGKNDGNQKFNDPITGAACLGSDLFYPVGKRWFLRFDSLPGDPHIKAVAVDAKALYLETSPLDDARLSDVLGGASGQARYETRFQRIMEDGQCLASITTSKKSVKGLAPRCLWTIPWPKLSQRQRETAIGIADLVYSKGAYQGTGHLGEDASDAPTGTASEQPELRLELNMVQTLRAEQRPELSIELEGTLEDRQEQVQRQELRQILALQQRILHMQGTEIVEFFAKVGEKEALKVIAFVLAGKVKNAAAEVGREISWREARRVARGLLQKK